MQKIYCIVSNYNDLEWVDKCLSSLEKSEISLETIVVDDASTDGSVTKIEKNYPEINLIRLMHNAGYCIANNIGIKKALENNADYVFLLNMDAWIENDTIKKLIQVAENNPSYGILSPMQLNAKGDALDTLFSTYLEPSKCPGIISDLYTGNTKDVYRADNVMSAAWLVRADVIKKVGLFDEDFFVYGGDDNYVDRLKYHNWNIGVVPDSVIYHAKDERTEVEFPARLDFKKQDKRALVNALDPNKSLFQKFSYHTRKSFSDILINTQQKNWSAIAGNIQILFKRSFSIIRHNKRYK